MVLLTPKPQITLLISQLPNITQKWLSTQNAPVDMTIKMTQERNLKNAQSRRN